MSFTLDNVSFAFNESRERPIINNLSVELPGEGVTAILGRSGSGKSTLLNLLGLLWEGMVLRGKLSYGPEGESGEYQYQSIIPRRAARLRRNEFGFVLQSCYLLPNFSCIDNIGMPLAIQGMRDAAWRPQVEELVKTVGDQELLDDFHRRPSDISGGQRQRAAVLRAMIHQPRVIFADEPVSNLDDVNSRRIEDIFRRWLDNDVLTSSHNRWRSLILVTHDADFAWRMTEVPHSRILLLPAHRDHAGVRLHLRTDFQSADDLRHRLRELDRPS